LLKENNAYLKTRPFVFWQLLDITQYKKYNSNVFPIVWFLMGAQKIDVNTKPKTTIDTTLLHATLSDLHTSLLCEQNTLYVWQSSSLAGQFGFDRSKTVNLLSSSAFRHINPLGFINGNLSAFGVY